MTSPDTVASSSSPLDRRAASRDLLPSGTLHMWQDEPLPEPDRVFWPEDDAEVEQVLRAASEAGIPVIAFGAGSGVCGAAAGRAGSWVVDLKRLDRIGSVDPTTWTVEVGAGVNGQVLEDALAAAGWTLGHSPSSIGCSTVGGWIAARSAGQFSGKYGVVEDMVVGVDAVSVGQGAFHVGVAGSQSPSRRGADAWMDLLLGSEGTMAVITRARLRVRPIAKARWLRGYRMPSVEVAFDAMRELMQAELWPAAVRLYDPVDTLIGGRTKPKADHGSEEDHESFLRSWIKSVDGIDGIHKRSLVLPLSLPGLLNKVANRFATGCLLIVGWEGEPGVVEAASTVGHKLICAHGEDLGHEPGQRWYDSRHAVSYKLMPVFQRGGFADTMEVAARWSVLPRTYHAVRKAVSPHAFVMAHFSHVYPEGGSIYFSFAARGDQGTYERVWAAALEAVLASGATITHHHGVGSLKAKHAAREVGPAIVGWKEARAQHDPRGVMNPGRLFVEGEPMPPPSLALDPSDGLIFTAPGPQAPSVQARALWPWTHLPSPPRWQRHAWQTGWVDVTGQIGGVACALGRGPRSATGPDLRPTLVEKGADLACTVGLAVDGPRWMGEARVASPWAVAQAILRADLRPSMMGVVDGALRIGFRGPAAPAFGALASAVVTGGLTERAWTVVPIPAETLIPCEVGDARVTWVTSERAFRPREVADV